MTNIAERLERYSEPEPNTGCRIWTGAVSKSGYAAIFYNGSCRPAHRVAYGLVHGPVGDEFDIHHKCAIKSCVNVDHLEKLLISEHMSITHKGRKKPNRRLRPNCPSGHPYSGDNLAIYGNSRYCKICIKRRNNKCQ